MSDDQMDWIEHYVEAEKLLREAQNTERGYSVEDVKLILWQAQLHCLLSLAGRG